MLSFSQVFVLSITVCVVAGGSSYPEPGMCTTTTQCKMADGGSCTCEPDIGQLRKEVAQLKIRNADLQNNLNTLEELVFGFPSDCSAYIKHETPDKKYDSVPIYPQKKNGDFTPVIANCSNIVFKEGKIDIPLEIDIPTGSIEGRTLIVKAIPLNEPPYVMALNFEGETSDPIFFHLNPRFSYKTFIRNTFKNGAWQAEEKSLNVPFPFQYGVEFTWKITVDRQAFHVEQDGVKLFSYAHRLLPLSLIRRIVIRTGDYTTTGVKVTYVSYC